jgi:hypothetical protein
LKIFRDREVSGMFGPLSPKKYTSMKSITVVLVILSLWLVYLTGCDEEEETVTQACTDPPSLLVNPSPPHNSEHISIYTDLSWEGGNSQCNGLTASYDVYFGTKQIPSDNEFQNNTDSKFWDLDTLQYETRYYWWIVAKDGNGTTPGYVWRFRTEAAPDE